MFLSVSSAFLFAAVCLTNIAEVTRALAEFRTNETFDVTGTVTFAREGSGYSTLFAMRDATGTQSFCDAVTERDRAVPAGTVVRIAGRIQRSPPLPQPIAVADRIDILGSEPPPRPAPGDPERIQSGAYANELVSLTGVIREVGPDEIDRLAYIAFLDVRGAVIPLVAYSDKNRVRELRNAIGTTVSVEGLCGTLTPTDRRYGGAIVYLNSVDDLLRPQPGADPYDVPDCSQADGCGPRAVAAMGRCRATGRVLAVWQGQQLLLRADGGRLLRVTLAADRPPAVGDRIETAGFVETDLFRLNLSGAIWRPSAGRGEASAAEEGAAEEIRAADRIVLVSHDGRRVINARAQGRAFRLEGVVKVLPDGHRARGVFMLQSGGTLLPVDASSVPNLLDRLTEGCGVAVSGVCVVNTEAWRPQRPIPRATGVTLVVRSADDLVILSRPSWWTRGRLLALLCLIAALLVAIAVWNLILNRLVERRGRQLYRERIAHAGAELRTQERTRLATELHDSVSQNMAALAYTLTAIRRGGEADPASAVRRLPTLDRMLQSCRTELRQCLFDLRSNLFEERDTTTILRKAVASLGEAAACVRIRFSVPRARLHDTTLHALICIVRELVSNALRHAAPTKVLVAGAVEGGRLLISVTDDGRGFDPARRPGQESGHFGLVGIEGRVRQLGGTFLLESHPGRGTRAEIVIPNLDRP